MLNNVFNLNFRVHVNELVVLKLEVNFKFRNHNKILWLAQ